MKKIIIFFVILLTKSTFASSLANTYWGFAENTTPDGKSWRILVLGSRILDLKNMKIIDTQLYSSAEEGTAEYKYEFDFKKSIVVVISVAAGKKVGEGTFKCDGLIDQHKSCEYDYVMKGKNSYSVKGKDFSNIAGIYYREESQLFSNGLNRPTIYKADYISVDKSFYQTLRKKILKK